VAGWESYPEKIKRLDAHPPSPTGKWKFQKVLEGRVPYFKEALDIMPKNICLISSNKGVETFGSPQRRKAVISVSKNHQAVLP